MTVPDKVKTYEARIRILADKTAEQSNSFDRMQSKMFALVGLLLTLGGLLTYDAFSISWPDTVLEYIVFVAAMILLSVTSILIAYHYRAKKNWSIPIGPVEEVLLDKANNHLEALEIIHNDYIEVYHNREKSLDRRAAVLNASLYMFVTSVILLIALKIGG